MHKFYSGTLPSTFHNYFSEIAQNYNTRFSASNNYDQIRLRTDRGQRSIKYTGIKIWKAIPNEMKETVSHKTFSKHLKVYILYN